MPNQLIWRGRLARWWAIAWQNPWLRVPMTVLLALLLAFEIYYYRLQLGHMVKWPSLGVIIIVAILVVLWFKVPVFQQILGEGESARKRSRFHLFVNTVLLIAFIFPVSIYYIANLSTQQPQSLQQLSFIAVGLGFSAVSFGAASIPGITLASRNELVRVAKKFVLVTVLFILFVPWVKIFDFPPFKDIDVNSLVLSDINAWMRGLAFYLMVLTFYGGQLLFLFGVTDFIRSFVDLRIVSGETRD